MKDFAFIAGVVIAVVSMLALWAWSIDRGMGAGGGDSAATISTTKVDGSRLRTVRHDGHWWVVYRSGSPMHHPDCPECAGVKP